MSLIETVVIGATATSIVGSIGTDVLIATVTTTTTSIINMIGYLTTNTQPGINDILNIIKKVDLEFTVNIIEQLVKEQEGKELSQSIKKALLGVNEILKHINTELDLIKQAIDYHHTKYFNYWRGFVWNGNISTIQNYNDILKNRYSILFELLKIKI